MQAAIAKFGITAEDQGKKDCLVDWFPAQEIEGEPVSNKLADAMATAREIAGRNPDAIRANKRMLNALSDRTIEEALIAESEEQDRIIGKPNQVEAVMAEMEKRPARFS